ncbi:MAG: DUF1444 family protein [Phycisphaerales bacterium]
MPIDPEAFGEEVLRIVRRNFPDRTAELAAPMDLILSGRHLGLDNLHRMVVADPENGVALVETYLERLVEGDAFTGTPMPLSVARSRIMPRIQPESIFGHLEREQVAHVPFVNDTVVVFVIDMPHMTVSITTEQMIRWGMQPDDLERIARENLTGYAPDLPVQLVNSAEGGRAAIVSRQDGYDAARLLLGQLHRRLAPELRGDFYVATPARDMLVAFTCDPEPFVVRLRNRVAKDYRRLPYPITEELFIVTMDGVAGTKLAQAA